MTTSLAITRSEPGASKLAAALREMGIEPLLVPMVHIRPLPPTNLSIGNLSGVLITSRHALASPIIAQVKDAPFYIVGEKTADAARAMGLQVDIAAENMETLCPLLREHAPQLRQGTLLYLSGKDIRQNPGPLLPGQNLFRLVVYKAELQELPDNLADAIRAGAVRGIILQSPRVARHCIAELQAKGLWDTVKATADLICFSPAIAAAAQEAGDSNAARLCISPEAHEDALLALIRQRYL